jgi:hypothetical protein
LGGAGRPSINASRTTFITAASVPAVTSGLYGGVSNASGQELWHRGTQIIQGATPTTPLTANEIQIGRRGTGPLAHPTPFNVGFMAITTALSPANIVAFTTAVNTLMAGLGR